jgi:cytoskeletal protein CcmA (bactofilin family)
VEIQATGVVDGDVRAPRLIVQEGARINGSIQMEDKAGSGAAKQASPSPKPVNPIGGEPRPTP